MRFVTSAICIGLIAPMLRAGTPAYLRFSDVPIAYTSQPVQWAGLLNGASVQTVRVAMLGDSQETAQSAGNVYVPRMNYESFRRFGNMPETPLASAGSYWTGEPYGDWMVSGSGGLSSPYASPSGIDSSRILPGVLPAGLWSKNGDVNGGHYYGQVIVLAHDGANLSPGNQLSSSVNYFNPAASIRAEIFAQTRAESGEISYRVMSSNSAVPSLFNTVTQQGTLNLGLESPTLAIKSALTPALNYAGGKYASIEVNGTSDQKQTDFVGLRYRNTSDVHGMVFSSLAKGGYTLDNLLNDHADGGDMFAALGFQMAALHFGANDVNAGTSAQEFHDKVVQVIDRLRDWTDDPAFPVVLFTDPDRTLSLESNRGESERYAGALYEIAKADPNVMMINSRRITDGWGWRVGSPSFEQFVVDGAHYTDSGARQLAATEFYEMMRVAGAVPEPASLVLFAAGGALCSRRRRIR